MSALEPGMRAVDLVFCFYPVSGDPEGASEAERRALAWCQYHGMSVGRLQRDCPRGILFGDFDIQKWRNLSTAERSALHGTLKRMTGDALRIELRAVPADLVIRHPDAPAPREGDTPYMASTATPLAPQIDSADRLDARRLATARVLFGLVTSIQAEHGKRATDFYESHLALGLGKSLLELSDANGMLPAWKARMEAELPDMVEELFQRVEAIMENAAAGAPPS